jgi:hypothetical protein
MDFSFGIITNGENDVYIEQIIDSIYNQNIVNYEIIIVGNTTIKGNNIININFSENQVPKWITRKKNIITENARYENIVFLHDYIKLENDWYQGQLKSGNDFHIRMDKIVNINGERFRDWCIWCWNGNFMDGIIGKDCLIPYDMTHLSKFMYISGSYWIAKKYVMENYPLNENLKWGEGEDIDWSFRVRQIYDFNMNINSSVKILKEGKDKVFNEPNEETIKKLKEIQ